MRGVQMQLEQSRVGKTLLSPTMTPPMRRVLLDQQHVEALFAQVEGRLHAGDAARRSPGRRSVRESQPWLLSPSALLHLR